MTLNQKLEFSREVRQWLGLGISISTIAAYIYFARHPEKFEKLMDKITGGNK